MTSDSIHVLQTVIHNLGTDYKALLQENKQQQQQKQQAFSECFPLLFTRLGLS